MLELFDLACGACGHQSIHPNHYSGNGPTSIRSSNFSHSGLFLFSRCYLFHFDIPVRYRSLFRFMLSQSARYNPQIRRTHLSYLCVYLMIPRTKKAREEQQDKDSGDCSSDDPANFHSFWSRLPFNSFPSAILLLMMEVEHYFLDFTARLTRVGVTPEAVYQLMRGEGRNSLLATEMVWADTPVTKMVITKRLRIMLDGKVLIREEL
jgi:hypothetical protein